MHITRFYDFGQPPISETKVFIYNRYDTALTPSYASVGHFVKSSVERDKHAALLYNSSSLRNKLDITKADDTKKTITSSVSEYAPWHKDSNL